MEKAWIYIILLYVITLHMFAEPVPLKVNCDIEAFEYYTHWNGQCPNGTIKDEETGCCYGCPQCEPTKCRPDLHQFDKHWNGDCPSGSTLNVKTGCCVGCTNCSNTESQQSPQGDRPSAVCKASLNQFYKYWDGQCPSGTEWNEDIGCCTGCKNCGPGWMQRPGCKGHCLQCPPRKYSSNLDNNKECSTCTSCEHLNRREREECSPVSDTVCGTCLEGYQEDQFQDVCVKMKPMPYTSTPKPNDGSKCTYTEGKFVPHWDGTCPPGTGYDHKSSCCLPCTSCGPGFRHSDNCIHPCQPCPRNMYSNHPVDNYECVPCLRCELLHRKIIQDCSSTSNAKCGECVFGYYSQTSDTTNEECFPCRGSNNTACQDYFSIIHENAPADVKHNKDNTDENGDTIVSDNSHNTDGSTYPSWLLAMMITMLAMFVGCLIGVAAYIVWWKRRRRQKRKHMRVYYTECPSVGTQYEVQESSGKSPQEKKMGNNGDPDEKKRMINNKQQGNEEQETNGSLGDSQQDISQASETSKSSGMSAVDNQLT